MYYSSVLRFICLNIRLVLYGRDLILHTYRSRQYLTRYQQNAIQWSPPRQGHGTNRIHLYSYLNLLSKRIALGALGLSVLSFYLISVRNYPAVLLLG